MQRRRGSEPKAHLTIFNPLPVALHHYQRALSGHLGCDLPVRTVSIESRSSARALAWAGRLRASVVVAFVLLGSQGLLILWPSFGLTDIFLSRLSGGDRAIVVHDPVPLRRQVGYGRIARRLGRWGSRGRRVRVITHTELAAATLRDLGILCDTVLPHPVMEGRAASHASRPDGDPIVIVAGQCKSARDLVLLEELPARLPTSWRLLIFGRGWPPLPGWRVDDRFLTERELDEAIGKANVVLVPYEFYFQSGIATRAYELGVPVVGKPHEFLEHLYGKSWAGTVDGDTPSAWANTIREVVSIRPAFSRNAAVRADREWARFIAPFAPSE